MPPHCDAMDGPVVKAALAALAASDVGVVLPFVDEAGEAGVRALFDEVAAVRSTGGTAGEIAERLFLETVVRLHRATEGAPFTGLKPAGLDHGPVIPIAERAIVTGSPEELVHELSRHLEDHVKIRLDNVMVLKARSHEGLREARRFCERDARAAGVVEPGVPIPPGGYAPRATWSRAGRGVTAKVPPRGGRTTPSRARSRCKPSGENHEEVADDETHRDHGSSRERLPQLQRPVPERSAV